MGFHYFVNREIIEKLFQKRRFNRHAACQAMRFTDRRQVMRPLKFSRSADLRKMFGLDGMSASGNRREMTGKLSRVVGDGAGALPPIGSAVSSLAGNLSGPRSDIV